MKPEYNEKKHIEVYGMTRRERRAAIRKTSFTDNPKKEFEKLTGVKWVNTFGYGKI